MKLAKVHRYGNGEAHLVFWCAGCGGRHAVRVRGAGDVVDATCWGWNNSLESPTLTPSILSTLKWGKEQEVRVCHSFVEAGQIRYLDDCTHELAGQIVSLAPINEDPHDDPES